MNELQNVDQADQKVQARQENLPATFRIIPKSQDEALRLAQIISKSDLAPKDYKGKAENTFVAILMGSEIGLGAIQSIQNIAVINGRPSIYGDAALALVMRHPEFVDIEELEEGEINNGTAFASCRIKRTRHGKIIEKFVTFSIEDAKKAKLWGKQGPWTDYPKRMLQMRARSFALRDVFPDALKGLCLYEEAIDIPQEDYQVIEPKQERIQYNKKTGEIVNTVSLEEIKEKFLKTNSLAELDKIAKHATRLPEKDKEEARNMYSIRKAEIETAIFEENYMSQKECPSDYEMRGITIDA